MRRRGRGKGVGAGRRRGGALRGVLSARGHALWAAATRLSSLPGSQAKPDESSPSARTGAARPPLARALRGRESRARSPAGPISAGVPAEAAARTWRPLRPTLDPPEAPAAGSRPSRAPTLPPRRAWEPGARLGLRRPGPGSTAEVRLSGGRAAPRLQTMPSRQRPESGRVRPCRRSAQPGSRSGPASGLRWPRPTPAGSQGRAAAVAAPPARSLRAPGSRGGGGRGPWEPAGEAGRAAGRGRAGGAGAGAPKCARGLLQEVGSARDRDSARPGLLGRSLISGAKYFGVVSVS